MADDIRISMRDAIAATTQRARLVDFAAIAKSPHVRASYLRLIAELDARQVPADKSGD
jgi:hypothetical protein